MGRGFCFVSSLFFKEEVNVRFILLFLCSFTFAFSVSAQILTGDEKTFIFNLQTLPTEQGFYQILGTEEGDILAEFSWDNEWFKFYLLGSGTEWMSVSEFDATDRSVIVTMSAAGSNLYLNGVLVESVSSVYDLVGKELIVSPYVVSDSLLVLNDLFSESDIQQFLSGGSGGSSGGSVDIMFSSASPEGVMENLSLVLVGGSMIGFLFASYAAVKRFL